MDDFVIDTRLKTQIEVVKLTPAEDQLVESFNDIYNGRVTVLEQNKAVFNDIRNNMEAGLTNNIAVIKEQKTTLDVLLNEIALAEKSVRGNVSKILKAIQSSEKKHDDLRLEIEKLKQKVAAKEKEVQACQRTINEIQSQYDAENENLQKLRRQNWELEETQRKTVGVGGPVVFTLYVIGLLFPPLEVGAAAVAVGSAGGTLTVVAILEYLKTSLDNSISLKADFNQTKNELSAAKERLKRVKADEAKAKEDLDNEKQKPEIFRMIMKHLTTYQVIIQRWQGCLQNVIYVHEKYLSQPVTSLQQILDRNYQTFLEELKEVLDEIEDLNTFEIGHRDYLGIMSKSIVF